MYGIWCRYEWWMNVLQPMQSITLDNTQPTAHCPPGCRQPTDPSPGSGAADWPGPPHSGAGDRGDSAWRAVTDYYTTLHPSLGPLASEHNMNLQLKTSKQFCEQYLTMVGINRTVFRNKSTYLIVILPFPCASRQYIVHFLIVCGPASDYQPEYWLVKVWCSDHAHVPMSRMERWRPRTATTGPCLRSSNFVSERRPESGVRSRPAPGIYLGLLLPTPATLQHATCAH